MATRGSIGQSAWAARINALHAAADPAENLHMTRIDERSTTLTALVPAPLGADTVLPAIHRRAGLASILRDDRLELAIADDGSVAARVVAGATR